MDSDRSSKGPQPILGTGLNVSPQRHHHTNGHETSAIASEGTAFRHRVSAPKKPAARLPTHQPASLSSQTSSIITEPAHRHERDGISKNGEEDPQNSLFAQVYEWLQREKSKRRSHKATSLATMDGVASDGDDDDDDSASVLVERPLSSGADTTMALDKLEKILIQYATSRQGTDSVHLTRRSGRRRQYSKGLRRGSASESDFSDHEAAAPSVDAVLDNSKTLAYSGGGTEDDDNENSVNARRAKDKEAWTLFKSEILRLAHTMQLKGWRKLPMELATDIGVVRLSGALTNAVYVVTPPQNIPVPKAEDGSYSLVPRKPPP